MNNKKKLRMYLILISKRVNNATHGYIFSLGFKPPKNFKQTSSKWYETNSNNCTIRVRLNFI